MAKKADKKPEQSKKTIRQAKSIGLGRNRKAVTVRERTGVSAKKQPRKLKSRLSKAKQGVGSGLSKTRKRVTSRLPSPPDNRFVRVLKKGSKRFRIAPGFLVNAWREIKQVTWPNWRVTMRLTTAVFIFSVIFAVIVGLLDFGLDKLFKEVIIGND